MTVKPSATNVAHDAFDATGRVAAIPTGTGGYAVILTNVDGDHTCTLQHFVAASAAAMYAVNVAEVLATWDTEVAKAVTR
jgi:hypothetical protein